MRKSEQPEIAHRSLNCDTLVFVAQVQVRDFKKEFDDGSMDNKMREKKEKERMKWFCFLSTSWFDPKIFLGSPRQRVVFKLDFFEIYQIADS